MTSPVDPRVTSLDRQLAAEQLDLEVGDRYYNGRQPLRFLAPEVRSQVGNRLTELVINWPRVIVDSVHRRLNVEGFRIGRGGQADDELWRIWQANDLDEWSQMAHVEALVHGRAFLLVWGDDADPTTPLVTVESSHQMTVAFEPGARRVSAALKRWRDGDVEFATLYTADAVTRYAAGPASSGPPRASTAGLPWRVDQRLANPLGVVPVVPMVNRPRVLDLTGESELADVIPLADAVNKLATDMMVASEYHATKRRYATGIQLPAGGVEQSDAELRRLQTEAAVYWDRATKGKTWLAGPGVEFGQFDEASLDNFVNAIRLLTAQIAAVGGLPPDDLGLSTVNPASAEARRAAETVLINRVREKQRSWEGAYERAMRVALAVQAQVPVRDLPSQYAGMETIWADPQTPAVAQTMDAAVKGVQAGVIDAVQAQEDIGLTPVQRAAIAARRQQEASTAATADVEARMGLARRLVADDGLSMNAALAAVGLLQAAAQNPSSTPAPAGAT